MTLFNEVFFECDFLQFFAVFGGFWEVLGSQLGGENRFLKIFFDVFFEVDVGIDFLSFFGGSQREK